MDKKSQKRDKKSNKHSTVSNKPKVLKKSIKKKINAQPIDHAHHLPPGRIQRARHPIITLGLLTLVIGSIVAGLWLVSSSGLVTNRFKPQLESELSKALSRQVTVEKIEGGLFDRVVLKGVIIDSPNQPDTLAISIDRVVVQYSLWDIIVRKRPLAESLHQIELIRPLIEFNRSPEGKWLGPSLLAANNHGLVAGPAVPEIVSFPKIKITLYDGKIKLTNGLETTSIKKLKGLLNLRDPTASRLFLSGRTDGSRRQNVRLSGMLDLLKASYRLDLDATKIQLRPIERVIKVSNDFEIASGKTDVKLKIHSQKSKSSDLIPGAKTAGKLVLYDVSIKTKIMDELIKNIFGVVALNDKDLELKNLQAILGNTSWSANGRLKNLNNPWMNVKVESERLELADFLQSIPRFQRLNTSGSGKALIYINGKLSNISATANLQLRKGKIGQLRIRNFESVSRYQAGELRLLQAKGVVARGWISGQGKIVLPEVQEDPAKIWFSGKASNLELHDLASLAGIKKTKGTVNGTVNVSGSLASPKLVAKINSKKIQILGNQLKQVNGTLSASKGELSAELKSNWGPITDALLKINVLHQEDTWILKQLELFQKNNRLINASGKWTGTKDDYIESKISAKRVPINLIPLLPPALAYLNGTISFDGSWQGSLKAPRFQGRFYSKNIHRIGKEVINAKGMIDVSEARIKLKDLWIDKKRFYLSGFIDLKPKVSLHLTSKISKLPLRHLVGLTGIKDVTTIRGLVNGELDLSGPINQLHTSGWTHMSNLVWGQLKASEGHMSFSSNQDKFWLKEFKLKQKKGQFNIFMETGLDFKSSDFRVRSWMDSFKIGEQQWDGELKINGKHLLVDKQFLHKGKLSIEGLKLNKQFLPAVKGDLVMDKEKLVINQINWSEKIKLSGQLLFGKKVKGNLALNLFETDLGTIRKILDPNKKPLSMPVSGQVSLKILPKQQQLAFSLQPQDNQLISGQLSVNSFTKIKSTDVEGTIQMKRMPTAWLLDLFLIEDPIKAPKTLLSGKVDFKAVQGKLDTMTGKISTNKFNHGQWQFRQLNVDWSLNNNKLIINQFEALQPLGALRSVGAICDISPDGQWQLKSGFEADNFKFLSRQFHGHVAVNGSLKFSPHYDFKLALASQNFGINKYHVGLLKADLDYQDQLVRIKTTPDLSYTVDASLTAPPNGAVIFNHLTVSSQQKIWITGSGRVDGQGTSDILFNINDVNANIIAQVLGWPQKWQGQTFGSIHYTDKNKIPHFEIPVKIENGSVIDLPFDIFSGKIIIDHNWLYFLGPQNGCVLHRANKYTMTLSGKLPSPQTAEAEKAMYGQEMELKVSMPQGDLSFLSFIPHIESASGKSSMDLTIKGTMEYPSINGTATIVNGIINPRFYTPTISKLEADLIIIDNQLKVKTLTGQVGDGQLVISPLKDKPWIVEFRRLVPHRLNLSLKSKTNPLKLGTTTDYEFVSALADVDMSIKGTLEAPIIGGRLALSDGQFTFPARPLTAYTKQLKAGVVSYDDFKLVSVKNLWYYKDVVRAQLGQQQSVIFNGGKHQFRGDGEILIARGSMVYLNNDFTLDPNEETVFRFRGRDKPRLKALARTTIRNVNIKDEGRSRDAIIYLRAEGEVGALKLNLESDPIMSQAQIMSILTLGEDYSNWSQAEIDEKIQGAGARVLGRLAGDLLGREIEKGIKRITPLELDVIDIKLGGVEKLADSIMSGSNNTINASSQTSSSVTGTSLLEDTQIDVGKYLTDDLFLNYRGVLKETDENQGNLAWQSYLGLEYSIDPTRKIKVYKNFDTDSDQELFWGIEGRVQFEGWTPKDNKKDRVSNDPKKIYPTPTLIP